MVFDVKLREVDIHVLRLSNGSATTIDMQVLCLAKACATAIDNMLLNVLLRTRVDSCIDSCICKIVSHTVVGEYASIRRVGRLIYIEVLYGRDDSGRRSGCYLVEILYDRLVVRVLLLYNWSYSSSATKRTN